MTDDQISVLDRLESAAALAERLLLESPYFGDDGRLVQTADLLELTRLLNPARGQPA